MRKLRCATAEFAVRQLLPCERHGASFWHLSYTIFKTLDERFLRELNVRTIPVDNKVSAFRFRQ